MRNAHYKGGKLSYMQQRKEFVQMAQKKKSRNEEILCGEASRELIESELALICGGTGGTSHLPSLPDLFASQEKSSATSAGKTNMFGNLTGLDGLANLTKMTNGLLGTLIQ